MSNNNNNEDPYTRLHAYSATEKASAKQPSPIYVACDPSGGGASVMGGPAAPDDVAERLVLLSKVSAMQHELIGRHGPIENGAKGTRTHAEPQLPMNSRAAFVQTMTDLAHASAFLERQLMLDKLIAATDLHSDGAPSYAQTYWPLQAQFQAEKEARAAAEHALQQKKTEDEVAAEAAAFEEHRRLTKPQTDKILAQLEDLVKRKQLPGLDDKYNELIGVDLHPDDAWPARQPADVAEQRETQVAKVAEQREIQDKDI